MTTTIKITALTDIGANLAGTTLVPVVNMAGTPTTQRANLNNIANYVLNKATGANLGPVANVKITGGTAGQVLTTNGSNVLIWASGGNGTTGGSNTQVQFNDAGSFGGNSGFTFNKTTGILAVPFADVSGVANIVGGGATVSTKSVLNVASTFGSNSSTDPASAQAIRGRVTGANLTKTRNYVTGVTGQYLITGTNASEFIKAGILGVVGDQTTTADGAVVAYLDGDGGLTTANAAYAVSMKNSTPNSGFNYGLDLQFINLNVAGTTTTFKQADIRFNNGVKLVANTANNISINANVTVGNITATNLGNIVTINLDGNSSNVLRGDGTFAADANSSYGNSNVVSLMTAFGSNTITTTGNVSVGNIIGNGQALTGIAGANVSGFVPNANVANTAFAVAAANVSGLGNIATINLTGSNSNVLYGNGVFAAVAGGANTANVTFSNVTVQGVNQLNLSAGADFTANLAYLQVRSGDVASHIHLDTGNNNAYDLIVGDDAKFVQVSSTGNIIMSSYDSANTTSYVWTFNKNGNLTLPGNLVIAGNTSVFGTNASLLQTTDNRPLLSVSSGSNGGVSSLWVEDIGNVGTSNIAAVYANPTPGSGIVRIAVGQNGSPGPNLWDFNANGNLTLPGNTFAVNYANGTQVSIPTVGNIATINLDGSNSNVLYGNGTFAAVSTSFAGEMHVSKDGNDSTGTGTILRPYLTITHALTQVAGGRNTIVIHPGGYTENPTITSTNTQLITYDATGASTLIYGTVTIANTIGRIAGLKMTNLAITGNAQAYINSSTVDGQFTKSSSGYVEVDDCELQATGNVLISGSGITTIIGNKINNLVVNNAGASVLVKGADDCVMPQVTAGTLNIVDSIIRASSNTANALTASAGTVVTLMNSQIVTPTADNVARVSIAGYHSIISLVYDKANSTLSNSLNSVAYFQTANVDSLVSSGNITGGNISTTGAVTANIANITTGNITTINSGLLQNGNSNITITSNGNVSIQSAGSTVELVVTSTGANVTGTFNATGNISGGNISATGNVSGTYLVSTNATGNEGGEISLAQPPNGNLSGGITIDAYQNTLRMFEQGGTARGLSIDIANSPAGGGTAIGYRDIPQVAAGNVTLAATDAGKHYYSTTAGNLTLTIPLNSSVPFTTGTAISIVVQAAGNILVNAASGVTLYMAGNSTAANRVVGGYGMATLMKVASDTWFINGAGVA
jgi:hypothetical protein